MLFNSCITRYLPSTGLLADLRYLPYLLEEHSEIVF